MMSSAQRTIIVLALIHCAASDPAFGVQQNATWNGGGGNSLWSNALNWNIHVVPCNSKTVEYNVVIPTGFALVDHDPDAGDCTVRSLTLNNNSTLRISPGSSLTVATTASLCGKLEAFGNFTATESRSTLTSFSCTRARVEAHGGAFVSIDANQDTSTGLWSDDGSAAMISTFTWPLMTADDPGTSLSLPNVAHLEAGFSTTGNDTNIQQIAAHNGAMLDLSGLLTVRAPSSVKDRLEFVADDPFASIDLSSLTTLNSAGKGSTRFHLSNETYFLLPSVTSFKQVSFVLESGAFLMTDASPCTYSSTGFWTDDGSSSVSSTFTWPLISADGQNSFLYVPSITDMDVRIVTTGNDSNIQTISATNGGTIVLDGLVSFTAPASLKNHVEFNLDSPLSTIEMNSLTTLTTAGAGFTRFNISNGGALVLPLMSSMEQVAFEIDSGSYMALGRADCSYSSTGFWSNDGSASVVSTFAWPLMNVHGSESFLNLYAVTDIDAGIVSTGNDTNVQTISASDGGTIDLGGVAAITAPSSIRDRLEFSIDDSSSFIHLDSLSELSTAGRGSTRFKLTNGALMDLASITSMEQVVFDLESGATVQTRGSTCTYSSTGFWGDDGSTGTSSTFTWPLMTVSNAASLQLPGLTDIDAGFAATGNDTNVQTISLSDASLVLPDLQSITAPASVKDRLDIRMDGSSSIIFVPSLTTITSAGAGYTRFVISNSASELIESLSSMEQVVFDLDSASSLFVEGSDGTYSSLGFWANDGSPSVSTFTWPLMTVRNSALLLCTGLTVIDAGFASTGNDTDVQQISVTGGGHIELEVLQSIIAPVAANDRVELSASGAESFLYLPSLTELKSAGSGTFRIHLDGEGKMDTGSLTIRTPTTVDIDDAGTYLHVANGNLRAFASSAINLNDPGTRLIIDGSLVATNNMHMAAADGARINVGGNLSFTHTNENEFRLGGAIVSFDGFSPQTLEVGGLDVGLDCAQLTNDNFGCARLIIGQGSQTSVALRSDVDNGNQPGATPEALYLFGDGSKEPSLRIHNGSTLILNGLQVYLCDSGIRLSDLFGPREQIIPYDDGFIELGFPPVIGDLDGDGQVNTLDLGILLASWSVPATIPGAAPGCMDAIDCPADINRDGIVNSLDLGTLLGAWSL